MAALSVLIMFRYRRRQRVKPGMVIAGCALLILATAVSQDIYRLFLKKYGLYNTLRLQEMGTNTARLYQGFLTVGPHIPGGPEAYFRDVSQPTFITKSCLYNLQTLILDAVVVGSLLGFTFVLS